MWLKHFFQYILRESMEVFKKSIQKKRHQKVIASGGG